MPTRFGRLSAGLLAFACAAGFSTVASARQVEMASYATPDRVASGTNNGVSWTARSYIVGQTSTATGASGGNPIYLGTAAQYRGTVGLLMDYGAGGQFVCSGSLMSDRRSILTAGHCVSDGAGTANPISTTVFFYDGSNNGETYVYAGGAGVTTRSVSDYFVNSGYTGEVIDQNDIAVLRMSDLAPTFANSYGIYEGDLTSVGYNIAGYGNRSLTGGADGTTGAGAGAGVGRLRQGNNRYDFRLGDSDFNGKFLSYDPEDPDCQAGENYFCGTAQIAYSWIADFDNGNSANDSSCIVAARIGGVVNPTSKYCNTGVGALEVSSAGGDSGGPQFVDGLVASVTSYGLSFGTDYGDYKSGLQSSWGEMNGFVPTSIHADFIRSVLVGGSAGGVPEPATWAQMILGFGLIGFATRRRAKGGAVRA